MKMKLIVLALKITSLFFTAWGIYFLIRGEITNGLLALILGEVIDMDKSMLRKKE